MSTGKRRVTDQELLEVFEDSNEPFLTAPEVAEHFDITRQQIDTRLKKLYAESAIQRKKTGHATIWWLPD